MRKILFLFLFLGYSGYLFANTELLDVAAAGPTPTRLQHAPEFGPQKTQLDFFVYYDNTSIGASDIKVNITGPGLPAAGVDYTKPISAKDGSEAFKITGLKPNQSYKIKAGYIIAPETDVKDWIEKNQSTEVDYPKKATLSNEVMNCPSFIGLSWKYQGSGDAPDHVDIQKSYNGTDWYTVVAQLGGGETSYYESYPSRGSHATYRVVTYNNRDEAIYSNGVSVLVNDYVAPDAAINLRVSEGSMNDTSFRLTWDNPEEDYVCGSNVRAVWYILINRAPTYQNEVLGYTYPNATYYDIWGLNPNENFKVSIFSISDHDVQGLWSTISAKTHGPASAPLNLIGVSYQTANNNSAIGLSWDHIKTDADYFNVEVSTDGDKFFPLGVITSEKTELQHLNLSEGLPYTYRVKAGNYKYGESEWTYMNGYVTHEYTAIPSAPYGLNAKRVDGNVKLTWVDDSNKEEKYIIERSNDADGNFVEIGEVSRSETSFVDEDASGSALYYRVIASNPLGNSAPSNVAEVSGNSSASGSANVNIGILAYPNPTIDNLNISVPSELEGNKVKLEVYNQINQLVMAKTFDRTSEIELNFKRFTPGMYNVVVEVGNLKETKKIIKN